LHRAIRELTGGMPARSGTTNTNPWERFPCWRGWICTVAQSPRSSARRTRARTSLSSSKKLDAAYPAATTLRLILDNHSAHISKETQRYLASGPQRFQFVFVPKHSGCLQRDGCNSDCRWPGKTSNYPVSARDLSADAEFAEDLAIRYAEVLWSANPEPGGGQSNSSPIFTRLGHFRGTR
jgi:hypothetical protein